MSENSVIDLYLNNSYYFLFVIKMDFENIIREIDYYDYYDYYDDILWPQMRLPKVYLRDAQNPFEMPQEKFKKRYRFCQESVLYIISLVRNNLEQKEDNRGLPIAPEIAVLLCLRFYATASFQIVCADLFNLSQGSASNIVTKVSTLLAKLIIRFIKFPQGINAVRNRELFQAMGLHGRWPGLPGIDGAIDCTHIRIVSTPRCQHHEAYRNRKTYFSLNVQVIVGPKSEIMDIVARWAGSTHDSRIFQMSSVYMKYSRGILTGRLVGDNGYPTLPFMLTPIRPTPEDLPSIRYNRAQIKTRNIVERTFGMWKRRFPCLSKGLGNNLTTVSHIIIACAVLHNLALYLNDTITFVDEEEPTIEMDEIDSVIPSTSSGFVLRNSIIENLYT